MPSRAQRNQQSEVQQLNNVDTKELEEDQNPDQNSDEDGDLDSAENSENENLNSVRSSRQEIDDKIEQWTAEKDECERQLTETRRDLNHLKKIEEGTVARIDELQKQIESLSPHKTDIESRLDYIKAQHNLRMERALRHKKLMELGAGNSDLVPPESNIDRALRTNKPGKGNRPQYPPKYKQ